MCLRAGIVFIAAFAALLCGTAGHAQSRLPGPVDNAAVDAVRAELAEAAQHLADNDIAGADRRFDKALASPGFQFIESDLVYNSLLRAGIAALDLEAYRKAHDLLVRACGFDDAAGMAWHLRLRTAYSLKEYVDSAVSIAVIARRWPETLDQIRARAIFDISNRLDLSKANSDVRFAMLSALFDANWTDEGMEPNELWFDYVRFLLTIPDMSRATEVAARIDSPQIVLSLRVDKRFDTLVRARSGGFDIKRTQLRERARLKSLRESHPDRLSYIVDELAIDMRDGAAEHALEIADHVIARIAAEGSAAYSDADENYLWILDARAHALARLGRADEAVKQLRKAARRPEGGAMNVSQTLNLARLLARLGRTGEVEEAMEELGDMSPYGRMQLALNRLLLAVAQGDKTAVTAQLDLMRAERTESMGAYQVALVVAGRIDAAAALLIERLRSEDWRRKALSEMQTYADRPQTLIEKLHMKRWQEILARDDVKKALERVGRIESVPFTSGFL